MCLIAFNWNPDSPTPLVVAANRDEFYARPAASLAWWEASTILAGRDLHAGGTWMGVDQRGRFAALTNYRDPLRNKTDAPSRGQLVVDFLAGDATASDYIHALRPGVAAFNDFNLLLFDGKRLIGYESRQDRTLRFGRGVHAVSNAAFDTPWPKVERLKAALTDKGDNDVALFEQLADRRLAPDQRLPQTGVPLEWERALSAPFIQLPEYGTRASCVMRLGRTWVRVEERTFAYGEAVGATTVEFPLS
jgi:uncharacterized protein with NRDE domain